MREFWIPFNPVVLQQLTPGNISETLAKGPEFLLRVLQQDCGLLTYLIIHLARDAVRGNIVSDPSFDPLALLAGAPPGRIVELVRVGEQISSMHQLQSAHGFQLARISETLIVASTVASLTSAASMNPAVGFYKAVVKEAGLNLVAWNYPTLYAEALDALAPDQSLEQSLSQALGYSPEDLVRGLMTPENLSQEQIDEAPSKEGADPHEHFCAIGRALARAEFPELYPSSKHDWIEASRRLKLAMGPQFASDISRRITDVSQSYRNLSPQTFERLRRFNPERHYRAKVASDRVFANPFIKDCPPPIQVAIRDLYAAMPSDRPDPLIVQKLLGPVTRDAGFTGGCLFLINQRTFTLTPRTVIGEVKGREIRPVPLNRSVAGNSRSSDEGDADQALHEARDPIARAFISKRPVIEEISEDSRPSKAEPSRAHIRKFFAAIGEEGPIGVLYLEKPLLEASRHDEYALPTFRAINRSLSDALFVD